MADYPNSTLYRPPTQFDIDARTRAAQALPSFGAMATAAPSTAANAARAAAAKAAPTAPPFYGYGTPTRGGAGEGGVGMQPRGYPLPELAAAYDGGRDMQGDASQLVHTPGLPGGAMMSNVDGVDGAQKIVDAQGRTTYTNLGAKGYMNPSAQLPSVAGFLHGVRNMYGGASGVTNGGVPAPRYGAPSLSDRVSAMYDQYNQLMQRGDTQSLILAAGLRKHLANLTTAAAGAEYGQGQLALGVGHLGVAQGTLGVQQGHLGLQRQQADYLTTVHKGALNLLTGDKPDIEGARRLLSVAAGQDPDVQTVVPTPLGGYVHSRAQGPGAPVINKDGTTRFVPDPGQYPALAR